jgi:hypothetical protein
VGQSVQPGAKIAAGKGESAKYHDDQDDKANGCEHGNPQVKRLEPAAPPAPRTVPVLSLIRNG